MIKPIKNEIEWTTRPKNLKTTFQKDILLFHLPRVHLERNSSNICSKEK
jgi:hypothetical protein